MSGKRQHFIPRFLQEGFASRTTAGEAFTWVYRKGTPPFNANITNVGAEEFFYTDGDDTQADDLITDAEQLFSKLVRSLRVAAPAPVSNPALPQLIAHLEVRTRHLRESCLQAGAFLAAKVFDWVSDEGNVVDYIERRLRNDPTMLREPFLAALDELALPKTLVEPLLQPSAPLLPAIMAQIRPELLKVAKSLRSALPKAMKDAAKVGHIRALKKSISPEVKIQRYEILDYTVTDAIDEDLILGDSAVLFRVAGSRPYKAFLDKDEVLNAVLLPLTPRKALVGAREGFSGLPPGLRRTLARCSMEYFIAAENSDANNILKEQIGEDASLLTQEELEEMVAGLMKESGFLDNR